MRDSDTPIEVNEAAIAEELQLLREAKRLGEAGQPSPTTTLAPAIEARVVHRIDQARLRHIEWAARRLAVLNGDLARLDITSLVDEALQADKEFGRNADKSLNEYRSALVALAEKARRARKSLEEFRKDNALKRNPRYPEGVFKAARFGFIALLIVVEAAFNSAQFATGTDSGLLGGFGYAASLAFLNVFLACVLGRYVVRQIFHRRAFVKVCGFLGLALALTAMLGISLCIAHFRDALVADLAAPSKTALAMLQHAPFVLEDLSSWGLFGLSMLFAIVALFDGLSLDDLYPGYGPRAREDVAADREYQEMLQDLRADLEDRKEELLKQLEQDVLSAKASVARQEEVLQQKEKTLGRLEGVMFNAQRCMEALVTQFREENQLHRKGLPVPPSFSVMPTLKELALPDFRMAAGNAALATQHERLRALLTGIQEVKASIQSGFNQKFDALQSLDEQLAPVEDRETRAVREMTA
ncbi:hypothetical protein PQR29_03185 [Paraburkholderia strydomiana]|uniref:hypothetical protein n=1 Tax=Paraburkholderia strydomiana TaxID=1245417 RepID=UPI0038B98DC6